MFLLVLASCTEPSDSLLHTNFIDIPYEFPAINYPEDNLPQEVRNELGKMLFYDVRLSKDSSVSCASCHKPEFAFADNTSTSKGAFERPGTRNTPSIANVAYQPYFTREGGVPTLEMQVLVPIQEHNEFAFNIIDLQERLSDDSVYQSLSLRAYNRELDYFVIVRALSNFERSIVSTSSKFDQYASGDLSSLNDDELAGLELFFSDKTDCSKCHSGALFSSFEIENNGLYTNYSDEGRARLTGLASDSGLFKIPSLRNVAITSPYMHDGSIATLNEVIDHYDAGGKPHTNKSDLIRPLNLTDLEKNQLLAFLETLTDYNLLSNKQLQP